MSKSESRTESKYFKPFCFHGKDIRSIKYQKKLHRKRSLTRVVLFNIMIIILLIFSVWILTSIII